jgi:hypothetical protein
MHDKHLDHKAAPYLSHTIFDNDFTFFNARIFFTQWINSSALEDRLKGLVLLD